MTPIRSALALTAALVLVAAPGRLAAQSVADRTPNLTGAWTADPGVIQFNFIHRFQMTDPPLRKVLNYPTFLLGTGVTEGIMVGFNWAPNSDLVPAYPNEWELFGRALPLSEESGAPLDVSVQAGYNLAGESVDGEVLLARRLGPVRLFAAGRAFSAGFQGDEARYAVAGGGSFRLAPWLALSGDYAVLLDQEEGERDAWGAGVQLGVPYTPHSFSIQATNVNAVTLEGASRGSRTRWGFEYTVPITLSRYLSAGPPSGASGETAMEGAGEMPEPVRVEADTVVVSIANLQYGQPALEVAPGTTVIWVNEDPVQHTVTADDESFDSGLMDPNGTWARTFAEEGTFSYHCIPHPFMTGRVVVRAR